jgi:hypothetical protein
MANFHSYVSLLVGKNFEFSSNKLILLARIAFSGRQRIWIYSANKQFLIV